MLKFKEYPKKLLLSLLKGAFVRNKRFSLKSLIVKTLKKLFSTEKRRQLWVELNEQVVQFMKQSGNENKAIPIAESALELARLIGEPLLVSNSLSNLATVRFNSARYISNIGEIYGHRLDLDFLYKIVCEMYSEAMEINKSWLGNDSLEVGMLAANFANFLAEMKRYDLAELCYKEAIRIKQKHLAPDHHSLIKTWTNLALFYELTGQYDKAYQSRIRGQSFAERDTWLPKKLC